MATRLRALAVGIALAVLLAAGMVAVGTTPKAHAQAEVVGRYAVVQMPNRYKEAQPPYALSGELLAEPGYSKSGSVTGNGYLKEGGVIYQFQSGTWYWDSKLQEVDFNLTLISSSGATFVVIASATPGKPTVNREYGTVAIVTLEYTPPSE